MFNENYFKFCFYSIFFAHYEFRFDIPVYIYYMPTVLERQVLELELAES